MDLFDIRMLIDCQTLSFLKRMSPLKVIGFFLVFAICALVLTGKLISLQNMFAYKKMKPGTNTRISNYRHIEKYNFDCAYNIPQGPNRYRKTRMISMSSQSEKNLVNLNMRTNLLREVQVWSPTVLYYIFPSNELNVFYFFICRRTIIGGKKGGLRLGVVP